MGAFSKALATDAAIPSLIGHAVLVEEAVGSAALLRPQINIGVGGAFDLRTRPNFEIGCWLRAEIDQVVAIGIARGKAGRHTGRQSVLPIIEYQCDLSRKNVDALILARVPVSMRGLGARFQDGQIDTKLRQPQRLREGALDPAVKPFVEWRRIDRAAPCEKVLKALEDAQ